MRVASGPGRDQARVDAGRSCITAIRTGSPLLARAQDEPRTDGTIARSAPARTSASMASRTGQRRRCPPLRAGGKRILYYRNPMGLPDTSPTPKKDSMGMDYIPVYEGEDDGIDDHDLAGQAPAHRGAVGAGRAALSARRCVLPDVTRGGRTPHRRRRHAVRGFVEKVENVTTGDHVHKGQPLLRLYSPEIAAASGPVPRRRRAGYAGARRRRASREPRRSGRRDRGDRAHPKGAADDHLDGAAGRRRARAERRPTACAPCRATCCFASPTTRWSGCWPTCPSGTLPRIAEGQTATVRIRGLPERAFTGNGRADLPAPQHGDAHGPGPHRACQPRRRPASRHVCRRRDRDRAQAIPSSPCRTAP